jgi:addiction module RelB/DinJ family antitoxin
MKSAIINVKTTPLIKKRAQKVAADLGFGLSTLINGFLNQLVKDKKVEFTAYPKEEPSDYMIKTLQEAEEDIAKGRVSPEFDNAKDAVAWLNNESRKYEN